MRRLYLYGKRECPLCDKAAVLVRAALAAVPAAEIEYRDIESDETLFGRYGLRIPVLADAERGVELDWPFDAAAVERLLAG